MWGKPHIFWKPPYYYMIMLEQDITKTVSLVVKSTSAEHLNSYRMHYMEPVSWNKWDDMTYTLIKFDASWTCAETGAAVVAVVAF